MILRLSSVSSSRRRSGRLLRWSPASQYRPNSPSRCGGHHIVHLELSIRVSYSLDMPELEELEQALATLGELLAERGRKIGILVVGGGSLLLLGLVERPTADVDVVGFAGPSGYRKAEALPAFLADAVREVAGALGLGAAWLNCGPAGLIDFGLPPGLEGRVTVRRYGSLEVHLPAREDLICFKLYAAVDQGARSKHFADLVRMAASPDELLAAARWSRTHDPSPGFLAELERILATLGVEAQDADL